MQQKKIGRYEIKELLGAGGMGSVYRAFDPVRNGDVALKVINLDALRRTSHEQRDETLKRFRHEVRVIAQLQHVAIVPLFDSGDDNGTPYMVMPLMKGGSLEGRLLDKDDNPQPLPLAEIERILAWIAPALDKMHAQNIVHRDLKPANILFDGDDYAYIADFGIAKLTEGSITFNTGTIGTPAYMSPEQAHGKRKVDARSDVYSLGAMLYKMLTGERPYHQVHPTILPYYHINEPPPRLDELRSDLHPSWQTIIDKAMAKKPEERYQTAGELSAAVTQLLRDEAQEETRERKAGEEAARQAELARLRREAEAAREQAWHEKRLREAALQQAEAARQQYEAALRKAETASQQALREKPQYKSASQAPKPTTAPLSFDFATDHDGTHVFTNDTTRKLRSKGTMVVPSGSRVSDTAPNAFSDRIKFVNIIRFILIFIIFIGLIGTYLNVN